MLITTLLGVLFLVSQTVNWVYLLALHMTDTPNLYAFTFYTLTGLHALHVLGGLVPLAVITARAYAGRYSSAYHTRASSTAQCTGTFSTWSGW